MTGAGRIVDADIVEQAHSIYTLPPEKEEQRLALISRLCRLQHVIADGSIGWEHSLDCFCLQTSEDEVGLPIGWNWRNGGQAVEFIEQAVAEKLQRISDARDSAEAHLRGMLARLAAAAGVTAEDLECLPARP